MSAYAFFEHPDVEPGIVEEFAQAVESLENWVLRYEQRLDVVARPENHSPDCAACDPSPAVSAARQQLNRIHQATTRLVALNDRLEL